MDLFRKIFGRKKTATTAAPAPAPEKKRAAAEAAPAPAPKKPKKDNTNVLRRVNQLRDLRGRQALLFTCPTRQERKAASEAFELLQEYAERRAQAFAAAAAPPAARWPTRSRPRRHRGLRGPRGLRRGRRAADLGGVRGLGAPAGATLLEAEEARRAAGGAAPAGDADDDDDPVAKAAKKAADEAPADPGTAPPRSYAIQLKRRNADSFPKDIAIRALAKLVPPHHPVDLKTPDVTILVEVYKSLCGVAVVEGYAKHKGFNLHAADGGGGDVDAFPPFKAGVTRAVANLTAGGR
ncbi:hypothetical protein JL722_3840 [Aureococcus anophagefferens]|nr:hypothetical protein JL722_3840 [Aureococcus anophagefferens]